MADTDIVCRIEHRPAIWKMPDVWGMVGEELPKKEGDPLPFILALIVGGFFKAADKYTGDVDGEQLHTGWDPIERGEDGGYSVSQVRSKGKILISMIRRLSI